MLIAERPKPVKALKRVQRAEKWSALTPIAERPKPVKALKLLRYFHNIFVIFSYSRETKACEGTETGLSVVAHRGTQWPYSRETKACEGTETTRTFSLSSPKSPIAERPKPVKALKPHFALIGQRSDDLL